MNARLWMLFVFMLGMTLMSGCESRTEDPTKKEKSAVLRDTTASADSFTQAKPYLTSDPQKAEIYLREAIDEDLYNGQAHNNLGVLLLAKGDLYEAAREFEWARKLLPGHPDPRVNLAIAFEAALKHSDAIEAAQSAIEVQPGHLPAIQTLAFIQITSNQTNDKTLELLASIIERSQEPEWKDWAFTSKAQLEGRQLSK